MGFNPFNRIFYPQIAKNRFVKCVCNIKQDNPILVHKTNLDNIKELKSYKACYLP